VELVAESSEKVTATQGPAPIIDQFTKGEWIMPVYTAVLDLTGMNAFETKTTSSKNDTF
jgi:hypothetical protein